MSSTKTVRTYAESEFTSATTVNVGIFQQELEDDASVTEKPSAVYKAGTSVIVEWSVDNVSSGTFSAVDAAVAAHVGGAYASIPITEISEGESSDNSGDEQTKLTLDTGLLPAGNYLLGWYCELKTAGEVAATAAQVRLYADKNGGGEVERGLCTWQHSQYHDFGGSFPFVAKDGDRYELRLAYERLGASSNEVSIQRARMYCVQLNS
jgi:hypothetical protein